MTREDLVRLVYMSGHCPEYNCFPTTLKQCMECHNKELTEYENEIYNRALDDFLEECFARECDKSLSIAQLQSIKEDLRKGKE